MKAFIGLLYLAGVYRSSGKSTDELFDIRDGRPIFHATMSPKRFKVISRVIRFDDKESRNARRERDKLAPIRDVYDAWVQTLSKCFLMYETLTIDKQLVAFRGRCPFRQFMTSKPAKYGVKLWLMWDSTTSYALNLQVYMGNVGDRPEKKEIGRAHV